MSRLAGDKLIDGENSLAIRSEWVVGAIDIVWKNRNALTTRSLVLPVESFRASVYPLVYAAKAVASGSVEVLLKLSRPGGSSNRGNSAGTADPASSAKKHVGVSDVVSHLLPFLSSLDPPLIFEVGINMLSLADVPGGKPEWASASIIAILTLWDRQEFSSARESIVRAVVTNLHQIDLTMQVHTPRISARLIWAITEHFDMEGLDPLLADDPEDLLNTIISNIAIYCSTLVLLQIHQTGFKMYTLSLFTRNV